jgi:hypothetical protein
MPKIRQEINLTNVTADPIDSVEAWYGNGGIAHLDPSNYTGYTAYFEVLVKNSDSSSQNISLIANDTNDQTGTVQVTASIPADTTTWTLIRSNSFTLHATRFYYLYSGTAYDDVISVKSAKIVILQDAEDISDTQTQIEIGAYHTLASVGAADTWYAILEPKYWKYEKDKWNPTPTFHWGFTAKNENDMYTTTFGLEYDDGAFNWSGNIVVETEVGINDQDSIIYYESAPFTPVDGLHYRVAYKSTNNKGGNDLYNAKVIATQEDRTESSQGYVVLFPLYGGDGESSETSQALGQSFYSSDGYTLRAVRFDKRATMGSPTDNVYCDIALSIDGVAIATTESLVIADMPNTFNEFKFSSLVTILPSTTYYLRMYRDGPRDINNYIRFDGSNSGVYSNGEVLKKSDNLWGTPGGDLNFYAVGTITKLQTEYLLINEAQDGTGLQEFLIDWNPDEWDGVDNTYFHEHSADSGSSNTKLQAIADFDLIMASSASLTEIYGATGTFEEIGQSFTPLGDILLQEIHLWFTKRGGQTDNLKIEVALTIGGAAISNGISDWYIQPGTGVQIFNFSTPPELTAGITYYMRLSRSGARDITNYWDIATGATDPYPGYGRYIKDNGSWGTEDLTDLWFKLFAATADITNSDITGDNLVSTKYTPFDFFNGSTYFVLGDTKVKVAQSFTGDGHYLYKARFKCDATYGSPTGNLTINLYAHSGTFGTSSVPTESPLATCPAYDVTEMNEPGEYEFYFLTPYQTTNGTKYCIAAEYDNGDSSNYVRMYQTLSGSHNGNLSDYDSSWSAVSNYDLDFEVYSRMVMPATAKEIDSYIVTA